MDWNLLENAVCGPPWFRVTLEPFWAQPLGWNNGHMLPAVTSLLRSFDRDVGWWAHGTGGVSTGDNNLLGFCMCAYLALSWGWVTDHGFRRGTWWCLNGRAPLSLILRGKKKSILKVGSSERESSPSILCFILLVLVWPPSPVGAII